MPGPDIVRRNFRQYDYDQRQAGVYAVPPGVSNTNYTTVANQGRIVRVATSRSMVITKLGFAVVTAAGADDACTVAVYSSALVRLGTSAATTGKLNGTGVKTVDLTAALTIPPGVYYAGFSNGALGGTAGILQGTGYAAGFSSEIFGTSAGQYEFGTMAAAHPLPDPFVRAQAGSGPILALME